MEKNYNYEYQWDSYYCYPKSHILQNKLNIQNANALFEAEREITSLRIADAKFNPIKGNFDLQHLCAIHSYVFGDIYDWAGKIRWVNIAKGNEFTRYEFIETQANSLFAELKKEEYLKHIPPEKRIARVSYYFSEINVIHPFREGNGRSQRLFFEYLAENNGWSIDFYKITSDEMIEASAYAFAKQYHKMNTMFEKCISF